MFSVPWPVAIANPSSRAGHGFIVPDTSNCASNVGRKEPRPTYALPPDYSAILTGTRLAPQSPGIPSKTPAQAVPQCLHFPSGVRFHSDSTYQSRPISNCPH